jgi:hypothetical protein
MLRLPTKPRFSGANLNSSLGHPDPRCEQTEEQGMELICSSREPEDIRVG